MKSAGKARSNGLYRHIRTSKEIIRNLLNYYYKIKNISGNNLNSPLVGADLLDADGNIVYSEGFNHMGVLTPGQEFDGMLGIDSNNSYWEERDNITSLNLVYYMDNSHDLYTLETPVNVPIT